ncbi:hypothetical protein BDN72DRAFT_833239 [Pluteus cervinus]|uniref:Uncharacterized protein n=1 Tax=Pluteus cervinus TaxID=181527 RepID=A0ACD3BA49_9AGAR|nr:hypothetical protein BDN72DRAFT_833239 [Pluteus cervinus]
MTLPRLLISILLFGLLSTLVHAASDDKKRSGNNETIERTIQLRTHSLFAPYIDQDLQNRWWDFGADSYVNTNKHVRLTRAAASQMGWLWSRLAITATNFVVEVEFKITGESSHLFGDGLAVWLTKDRAQPGPVFGSKDNFEGLGIFLDTYANSRHTYSFPRIGAMLGDGKTSYDVGSDGDAQMLGGCSANFRRTNVATKLKITYLKEKSLDIKIQYKAWDDWMDCIFVRNFTLPTNPYLGFSALTGDVFDAHDIISISSSSVILASQNTRDRTGNKFQDAALTSNSWLTTFFKLVVFLGVCGGIVYAVKEYRRRQGSSGGFGGGNFGTLGNFGNFGRNDGGFGGGMRGTGGGLGGGMYDAKRF